MSMMSIVPVDGITSWKKDVESKRREEPLHMFAFLLYSRANEHLYEFVHKNFFELDRMTGPHFTVYVIWNTLLKDSTAGPDAMAKVSYELGAYGLAREFGIRMQKIPCFVFFRNVDDRDVFVYSLNDAWEHTKLLDEFERLTDDVNGAQKKAQGNKKPERVLWNTLKRNIKAREWVAGAIEKAKAIKPLLDVIKTLFSFILK